MRGNKKRFFRLNFPPAVRKAQTEAMSMTLFLLIAVILLFSVFFWGNSVIGGNSDEARLFSAERFMRSLDEKIRDVARNGGSDALPLPASANIRMGDNNSIEYILQNNANVPASWVYVSGDEAAEAGPDGFESVIREEKEDGGIMMQLYYRNRTGSQTFLIQPFMEYTGGGKNIIRIEGNGTSFYGSFAINRVRLSIG